MFWKSKTHRSLIDAKREINYLTEEKLTQKELNFDELKIYLNNLSECLDKYSSDVITGAYMDCENLMSLHNKIEYRLNKMEKNIALLTEYVISKEKEKQNDRNHKISKK
jgi:hypothetical protein